ncbi:hypothetical protein [Actinomadura sp. 21ATH]|uniref:hypothetical protein n=1 Tax=Actinomadura sp. 21ATH TaxID=1735444 RepID=UPI0035C18B5A
MNHRRTEEEEPERDAGAPVSGTGVPGVRSDHPDTLPPDEEGVREAERTDDSGDDGWKARPGRPSRDTG